ncbi:HD domain-containing protein [Clostridium uliginosum]|uniref:Histidine kinase-, DNA gyrase B-, and HSP90-like ATPase n=1 Tax=Clostridium uliginosum TaxID=119641 RepID=A0A1I1NIV1_9CLOT|nr:ATP-binding protein [Clostridium uliginosum]SFC97202.1 Histidine kinase-, DNA gyrase B-, and HSP90-like ATPase [Clostridium uliginosum]
MDQTYESVLISKLKNNVIYKELKRKCSDLECGPKVLSLVHEVGQYSIVKHKTVMKNMAEFTLHDEDHIFNMLFIIGKLIPKQTLEFMSIPDLMLTLLSVFLHDIGMCPEENQIKAWKNQLSNDEKQNYEEEIETYKRFRMTYTQQIEEIETLNNAREYSKAQLLEDFIVTEYIRITHSDRARKIIASDWRNKIIYNETDLTVELAEICFSHNQDYTNLLNMETIKICDTDVFCCMPFIAVLLRLSDIIDFDTKRTPSVLFSHLTVRNPISLSEWRKHQAVKCWSITNKKLVFTAECSHPAIEATIRQFCDLIDNELRNCTLILSNLNSDYIEENILNYKIPLPARVDRRKIAAIKDIVTGKPIYRYNDTKFTLSKSQVIDLLMGTKLYGKPDVALRELIQNSIDACLLRQKLSERWGETYKPEIEVEFYNQNGDDYLKVKDNGVGMNQHIIDKYYTNIGCSYYKSREFYEIMADIKSSFKPISRFGIGILACFMVCDSIEVNTRRITGRYQFDEALKIAVEGYESLFSISDSDRVEPGTETILRLRKLHPWDQMNKDSFKKSVKNLVPLPPFEITIKAEDEEITCVPNDFEELDLSLLKDYTWKRDSFSEKNNIKIININLNSSEYSFRGNASIAYIVSNGIPVNKVELVSKDVLVDGECYSLSYDISYGTNCINKNSTQIEINENGEIESNHSFNVISKSKSALSIHGIDVPCSLFSDYTNFGQKAVLKFPFPIIFRLDIGEGNDLNLNSARTQIIYDNIWMNFEKQFFEVICTKIKEKMDSSSWSEFKVIIYEQLRDNFLKNIIEGL